MATSFDANYVRQHRQKVHDYESFGRAIAELLLRAAEEQLQKVGAQSGPLKLSADVTISPIPATQASAQLGVSQLAACVDVQVCVPLVGCSSVHVGVS
jgi:hypothetical protein